MSVVLAAKKDRYIDGLIQYRDGYLVTGRSKSSTTVAVDQLVDAGILHPLSESKRNRAWEAAGLLDLLAELEAGG